METLNSYITYIHEWDSRTLLDSQKQFQKQLHYYFSIFPHEHIYVMPFRTVCMLSIYFFNHKQGKNNAHKELVSIGNAFPNQIKIHFSRTICLVLLFLKENRILMALPCYLASEITRYIALGSEVSIQPSHLGNIDGKSNLLLMKSVLDYKFRCPVFSEWAQFNTICNKRTNSCYVRNSP